MNNRPHTTTCNRCGESLSYRYGAKPRYCDHCESVRRLREARKR